MSLQTKEVERESLLNFALFTYFWRAGEKREYETIIIDMNNLSRRFVDNKIIKGIYTKKEIVDELYRLKDWRVLKESAGSAYFKLKREIMDNLNENEKEILRIAQGNKKHEFVLKTIQEFQFL